MRSFFKHFLLGLVIGTLSIVLLLTMYNSVMQNDGKEVSVANAYGIILIYGAATAVVGEILEKIFMKKKKKR